MPDAEPSLPLVTVDTNVFVSGLVLRRGWPLAVLEAWRNNKFRLILSATQFSELAEVFQREHLYRTYEISLEEAMELLRELAHYVVADGADSASIVVRDPDDASSWPPQLNKAQSS